MNGNTRYEELESSVFDKIKELDFMHLSEETASQIVHTYLRPAIVQFQSAKQDLTDRDDMLGEFNFKLTDETFEILSNFMVLQWLSSNYMLTTSALKPRLSPSDFKALNLQQNLDKVTALYTMLKAQNDQLAINKSYNGSNLFDIVKNRKRG